MNIGKLSNEQLEEKVLSQIKSFRTDVVLRPGIGIDCGAVTMGGEICVFSSDPITAAQHDSGALAVTVSMNDVAAAGAQPVGLLVVVMAPPGTPEAQLTRIMQQANDTAAVHGVEILGGHTEYTDAVTRTVLCVTAIGRTKRVVSAADAKIGDALVLSKYAALEGTGILARDFEVRSAQVLDAQQLQRAQSVVMQLDVLRESSIAMTHGVHAMHDVTEGGVLGAAWEMAQASGIGIDLYQEKIPLMDETRLLCKHFDLDPYRLISSGALLMAVEDEQVLIDALQAQGIPAACIGYFTARDKRMEQNGIWEPLEAPESDEIYKVYK